MMGDFLLKDDGNLLDAPLAEALAVDSGSEHEYAGEEEDELTEEQLRDILEANVGPDIPSLPDLSDDFNWTDDYTTFSRRAESFLQEFGSRVDGVCPVNIFCTLWDQTLVETIRDQTNLYAWQTIMQASETGISTESRLNEWVETSVPEIYRLIAITILMGICSLGRVDEFWHGDFRDAGISYPYVSRQVPAPNEISPFCGQLRHSGPGVRS